MKIMSDDSQRKAYYYDGFRVMENDGTGVFRPVDDTKTPPSEMLEESRNYVDSKLSFLKDWLRIVIEEEVKKQLNEKGWAKVEDGERPQICAQCRYYDRPEFLKRGVKEICCVDPDLRVRKEETPACQRGIRGMHKRY